MKGKKYLARNVSIMTISQFGSKILSFFLVPLYTSILSLEDYGTFDLLNTTVALLVPILMICISDAALRFSLDEENDKTGIFTVCIKKYIVSQTIVVILVVLNCIFGFNVIIKQYSIYLILLYMTNSLSGIIINFARGLERIKEVGISGVLCSVFMLGFSVLFLLCFNLGLDGYFIANIIGPLTQIIYLFVVLKLWKFLDFRKKYHDLRQKMQAYSTPLIANSVAWWVNNVSDRYVVTWLAGIAANGIYSVAYKIPTILSVFQGIFNQAWTLSAVKEYDEKDSGGFFSDIYNLYNFAMVILCSAIIIFTRLIADIMFAKDFYEAWIYVPWLLISIVFGAISGYLGGIFAAVKNTKVFAQTTVLGAGVNTVLNIILVIYIGPLGAALATLISNWLIYAIRIKHVRSYIEMNLNLFRDYCSYVILVVQAVLLCIFKAETLAIYAAETGLLLIIMIINTKELRRLMRMISGRFRKNG